MSSRQLQQKQQMHGRQARQHRNAQHRISSRKRRKHAAQKAQQSQTVLQQAETLNESRELSPKQCGSIAYRMCLPYNAFRRRTSQCSRGPRRSSSLRPHSTFRPLMPPRPVEHVVRHLSLAVVGSMHLKVRLRVRCCWRCGRCVLRFMRAVKERATVGGAELFSQVLQAVQCGGSLQGCRVSGIAHNTV